MEGKKKVTIKQVHGPDVNYVFSTQNNITKVIPDDDSVVSLCILPSKILSNENFNENHMNKSDIEFRCKEFIEGTFICLFYDERICGWEIASKNSIGCNYWYIRNQYKVGDFDRQLTFRQMFIECLCEPFDIDLNEVSCLKDLSKSHIYHFVIQHPANKMVLNIQEPKAYLVDIFERKGQEFKHMAPETYMSWPCFKEQEIITFPSTYVLQSLDYEYQKKFFEKHYLQGLVVSHIVSHEQTIFENETYRKLKELRGNHPNLQYLYLCLIKENKISEFLCVFPIYKTLFDKFRQELFEFVCELHKQYVSYYVQKKGELIPKKYFPLVYKLHHDVFLIKKQQDSGFILRRKEVDMFFKSMEVGSIIFHLNQ